MQAGSEVEHAEGPIGAPSATSRVDAERALELAFRHFRDFVVDPGREAWHRAHVALHDHEDEPWRDRVARAAEAVGLEARPVRLGNRWRWRAGRLGAPALGLSEEDGVLRWWVYDPAGPRGRVFRVVSEGTITDTMRPRAALARWGETPAEWWVLEPTFPLQLLESDVCGRQRSALSLPIARVAALIALDRRDVAAIVGYGLFVGALSLASPVAVQALVNTVAFGSLVQPVIVLALLLAVVLAFNATLNAFQFVVVEALQRRQFARVIGDVARRLPFLDMAVHRRTDARELVNRAFDVITVQKSMAKLLLDGVALVVVTAVGVVLLATYHPALLLFGVGLAVALVGVVFGLGWRGVETSVDESTAKYSAIAWLERLATPYHPFRSSLRAAVAVEESERRAREWLTARRNHFRIVLRQLVGGLALQAVASALLLALGGWLVVAKQLAIGQLIAAELVVAAMGAAYAKLGRHMETFYDLAASAHKLGKLVDLPTEARGGESVTAEGPATVELRGVTLGTNRGKVLGGIDLHIGGGEHVVLTGQAGSGKSLVLDLLDGAVHPDEGWVSIDGVDLRVADVHGARDDVWLVRHPFCHGTVLDTMRIGALDLDAREAAYLLDVVGLGDTIHGLPEGINTALGTTDCAPLSHGEARRLALAQAMAAAPRLLLLDGTLDGLAIDDATKGRLVERLLDPRAPWTVLATSTDPDMIQRFPRRIRVARGHISEDVA